MGTIYLIIIIIKDGKENLLEPIDYLKCGVIKNMKFNRYENNKQRDK